MATGCGHFLWIYIFKSLWRSYHDKRDWAAAKKLCRKIWNYPKVVYPHSFCHRYAKNFLGKYNDIALLADLMGHVSIETTRIYLRRTATEQQELINKIVTW